MHLAGSHPPSSKPRFYCSDCGNQGLDGMICYPLPSTSHGSDGDPNCLCCPKDTSHYSKDATVDSMQLHGFCDASEDTYAGWKWEYTYLVGRLKYQSCSHQMIDDTTTRTLWCSTTCKAPTPHQASIEHPNSEYLRVD